MANAERVEAEVDFDASGEHPTYTRRKWRQAVAIQSTTVGYTDWVRHNLESNPHVYVCAIRIALRADSATEANDSLNEVLRQLIMDDSCNLLDWNYDEWGGMTLVSVPEDFGVDSGVPQLPNRVVRED